MKFTAFLLLSIVIFAVVVAFPSDNNALADSGDVGQPDNAVSGTGTESDATSSQTSQLRQPRHFLKKFFHSEPRVIVQPILVQSQPYYPNRNPYIGAGRGYSYGYGYNKW